MLYILSNYTVIYNAGYCATTMPFILGLVSVNSCKSKSQVNIMVVNQNYHLLANHNSVVFTANLQLTFIILQPLKVVIRYIIIVTYGNQP